VLITGLPEIIQPPLSQPTKRWYKYPRIIPMSTVLIVPQWAVTLAVMFVILCDKVEVFWSLLS